MSSRRLEDLVPEVADKVRFWVDACTARGVDVLVYCTLRTWQEQAALWAQGRTRPGLVVTNAKPWDSWHQYGRAVDAVPLRNGKPIWRYDSADPAWQVFGEEAEKAGLEWAGRWKSFREYVHVQWTGGLSLAQARQAAHTEGVVV